MTDTDSSNPFAIPLRDYDLNPFIHPQMGKHAYAGHLIDVDGRDFVDFMSAWGTNLLGYGYRPGVRAAVKQLKQFNSLGMPFKEFYRLRDLICELVPSAEDVRYGKNGSDVCAGAVRLVRAITNRELILYHGYHGFHDWFFASTDCPGIPRALRTTVKSQEDLTPAAIEETFSKFPGQIAGLILNPLTGPMPDGNQMKETIDIVHNHGGLVIFDEMLSGFRVAIAGMQEILGLTPDLSCFGKSIANGLPLSVLCGKFEYIKRLPETYYGMTFEGEAVSIAAAIATITEIRKRDVIANLYDKGRAIRQMFNESADRYRVIASVQGFEPCMNYTFPDQSLVPGRQLLWLFTQELVKNGIFTLGAFLICYSHSKRDLAKLGTAIDRAMKVVSNAVQLGSTEGLLIEEIRRSLHLVTSPANWRKLEAIKPGAFL